MISLLTMYICCYHLLFLSLDFDFDANIMQAEFQSMVLDNAQVTRKVLGSNTVAQRTTFILSFNAESGRTDVVNTINDFISRSASRSAFENCIIVDDNVLEFDELLIAEFSFAPEISNTWNAIKGEPSTAFILIRDEDCELCRY